MSHKIFLPLTAAVFCIAVGSRFTGKHPAAPLQKISREDLYKTRTVYGCSPDWNEINTDSLAAGISVLPGWGNYRWNINTKNDSANFYFNQGINLYYAFHIIESMASFKKAQQFDDKNAMIYWGQALAYGPNINDFEYAATPDAYAAIQKAVSLQEKCTAKEKALIGAMAARYSNDSTTSRELLNQQYTGAMQASYTKFSADADLAALYADAMMCSLFLP